MFHLMSFYILMFSTAAPINMTLSKYFSSQDGGTVGGWEVRGGGGGGSLRVFKIASACEVPQKWKFAIYDIH